MNSSVGKRQRERQKTEKAEAKAQRKAARKATDTEPPEPSLHRSESELMEDLGALHRALEVGDLSPEEFEVHRDRLRAQFDQLPR